MSIHELYPGKPVYIEYLNVDEIEAVCWMCDYSFLAYIDNYDMFLKLSHMGTRDILFIKSVEDKRIELSRSRS